MCFAYLDLFVASSMLLDVTAPIASLVDRCLNRFLTEYAFALADEDAL